MARCEDCIHYGVCIELERYRDPLWFTNTKDEFCCSSYLAADVVPRAEVAREIFEEIEFDIHQLMFDRDETRAIAIEGIIDNLKKKYTQTEGEV